MRVLLVLVSVLATALAVWMLPVIIGEWSRAYAQGAPAYAGVFEPNPADTVRAAGLGIATSQCLGQPVTALCAVVPGGVVRREGTVFGGSA